MKHCKSQVSGGFYMEGCPSIGSKMLWIMNTYYKKIHVFTPHIVVATIFKSEKLFVTLNQYVGYQKTMNINHHNFCACCFSKTCLHLEKNNK